MKIILFSTIYKAIQFIVFPIFLFSNFKAIAQPINNLVKDVVMPAPNAAALGKYGDIPVSYFTGVPNIGVPIHTVQSGPLSTSVSLNYHAAGIKLAETASWVGMNWSTNAGGMISRTIQGIADDGIYGYYNKGDYYAYHMAFPNLDPILSASIQDGLIAGQYDGEPDIFNFNVGGVSGKFFFDKDKICQFVPKQDFKIIPDGGLPFQGFTLITSDGTRYIFGKLITSSGERLAQELSRSDGESQGSITSWYLLRTETADLKYNIDFYYENESYSYKAPASCKIINWIGCVNGQGGSSNSIQCSSENGAESRYIRTNIEGKRLTKIATPTENIEFIANTERLDLEANFNFGSSVKKALDTIKIYTTNSNNTINSDYCSKYAFSYDYYIDPNKPNYPEGKRLRLNSIQKSACNGTMAEPPYEFIYESGNLPYRLSKQVDHWGYYNGQATNEPNLINAPPTTIGNLTYGSSNRNPSEAHTKIGVLTQLKYPTGGKTTFNYESNVVNASIQVENIKLDIKSCTLTITQCCGTKTNTSSPISFSAADLIDTKATIRLDRLPPSGNSCYNSSNTHVDVTAFRASDSASVWSYSLNPAQNQGTSIIELPLSSNAFQANVNYFFVISSIDGYGALTIISKPILNNNTLAGGLRVKEIRSNDGVSVANDIVKIYNYSDEFSGFSSGKLLVPIRYGYTNSQSNIITSENYFLMGGFGSPNPVGYTRVKESLSENGVNTLSSGYNTYKYSIIFDYMSDYSDHFPVPPLNANPKLGELKESYQYNDNNQVAASSINTHKSDSYTTSSGYMVKTSPALGCTGLNLTGFANFYTIKQVLPYRMESVQSAKDNVTTITNYTYSTDPTQPLFPITTSMQNSDGSLTTTTTKYITHPDFLNSTNDTISKAAKRMKTLNIIANPIETVSQVGSFQTNGSRMIFSCFNSSGLPTNDTLNNYPYPYKFYKYKMTFDGNYQPQVFPSNGGWDLEGTINEYDPLKGKPKKFSMPHWADPELYTWAANGLIETRKFKDFTWAYEYYPNTRLVKKITNMDGQYSLFEYDNFQRVTKATARGGAVVTDYTYKYQDPTQSFKNWIETKTTFTAPIGGLLFSNTTFKTARHYLDGLGRPIQSVAVANSPEGKDVISAITYDNQGREWKKYEPYESTFNNGNFIAPTNQLFTELKYEQSPLSRIWKSILPNGWESANTVYGSNTGNDAYNINTWSNYTAGTVYKTTTTDPDGRISIVYTNKTGNKIQTEQTKPGSPLNTMFYNYDHKSRLSRVYTVRNQYEEWFTAGDIDYLYAYDWHDNLIQKYIPGQAYVGFTYNERNQMILTHDGNMRSNFKWLATTYDTYGRITATGMTPYLTYIDPVGNPAIVDSLTSTIYSSATAGIELGKAKRTRSFYNNGANNIETLFDYDSYGRVNNASSNNHLYTPSGTISATNFSEKITTTYDLADNVLVKLSAHKSNATRITTINETTDYDNGLRLKQVKHQVTRNIDNQITILPEQIVSKMDYTLKNQVQTKQMGQVNGLPFLQKVDYQYNVLGWLTGINNLTDLSGTTIAGTICEFPQSNETSTTNLDVNDLFMLDLRYDNPLAAYAPAGTTAPPQYNGNISQAIWRVRGRERQSYSFQYDFLNRMTEANYAEINNLGVKTNDQNKYMEKLTYDLRGNINTLKRNGLSTTTCGVGLIDDLTYFYNDNAIAGFSPGNRLKKVFDVSDKTKGFKTQPTNTNVNDAAYLYTYDANGNLKTDPNKKITNIQYNHLNLPTQVTFTNGNAISFLYDGGGNKLRKTVSGTENYTQDYVGGIEYRDNNLEAIYHSEGRITTINGSLKYEYALRDHLGNTRVMFCDKNNDGYITPTYYQGDNEVTQENSYYPFGLAMEGYWMNNPSVTDNKYGYNGKELNSDFGLDWNHHDWRFLDVAINRFVTIDPKSEEEDQEELSPYHFAYNNPIRYDDPDGQCPTCATAAAGAVGGAAWEYGSQVIGNLFSGKSIGESFTDVDGGKILEAAVVGAIVGSGAGLLGGAASKLAGKVLDKADDGGRYLYRALSKTDDISKGLSARSPGTITKEVSHVAGKKQSQWISTTKDKAVAINKYNREGNGVVKIDLKKVKNEVSDISGGIKKGGRFSNYAKKDKEVLIKNHIPKSAIKWEVKPIK